MRCPYCLEAVAPVGRKWGCEDHGLFAENDVLPGADASPADARVLDAFPSVIARAYLRVVQPESQAGAFQNLMFCMEGVLRAAALAGASAFLGSEQQHESIARALRQLQNPDVGKWKTVVVTLGKHMRAPFWPPLHEAMRTALEVKDETGQPLLEAFQQCRNDQLGHGHGWTEEASRDRLALWRPRLLQLCAHFDALGDLVWVARRDGALIALRGHQAASAESRLANLPSLYATLIDHEVALLAPDDTVLPVFPLFASNAAASGDTLVDYSGYDRTAVQYIGAISKPKRSDALPRLRAVLERKRVDPQASREEFQPWKSAAWSYETTGETLGLLTGTKYLPEEYVARRGVEDALERWLSNATKAAVVVGAPPGAGKTSLLCRLAESLRKEHPKDATLLVLGGDVHGQDGQRLFRWIRRGLGLASEPGLAFPDMADLLSTWHSKARRDDDDSSRRLVVMVDAVNEAHDLKGLILEVVDLAIHAARANANAGRQWVRLCVSVRSEHLYAQRNEDSMLLSHAKLFEHFPDETGTRRPWLTLRSFRAPEAQEAYERPRSHGSLCPTPWLSLDADVRRLLQKPLHIRLFHEAFSNRQSPGGLRSPAALWREWLSRTFESVSGSSLRAHALDLIDACIDAGSQTLTPDLVAEIRMAWLQRQSGEPALVLASGDPVWHVFRAGLLRRTQDGGYDWLADELAGVLIHLALRRRDPDLRPASLRQWLAGCVGERLTLGLALLGVDLWESDRHKELVPWLDGEQPRWALAEALRLVAPTGGENAVAQAHDHFAVRLNDLADCVLHGDATPRVAGLFWVLTVGVGKPLAVTVGAEASAVAALDTARRLAATRVARAGDDSGYLQDLMLTQNDLGSLVANTDTLRAQQLFRESNLLATRLHAMLPHDRRLLCDLLVCRGRLAKLDGRSNPEVERQWWRGEAMELALKLAQAAPDDAFSQHVLAVVHTKIGDLDASLHPEAARRGFEKAVDILEKLVAGADDGVAYLRDLAIAYRRLGDLERQLRSPSAKSSYQKSVNRLRQMVELDLDDPSQRADLALSMDRLGDLFAKDDRGIATSWYEQAMACRESAVALDPSNVWYLRDLSLSFLKLGEAADVPDIARAWYERCLEARQSLLDSAPQNLHYVRDVAIALGRLGELDTDRARSYLEQSHAIWQRLTDREPDNASFRRNMAASLGQLAHLDRLSAPDVARARFEQAVALGLGLVDAVPGDVWALRDLSAAYASLGELDAVTDVGRAASWFQRALAIEETRQRRTPDDTDCQRRIIRARRGLWNCATAKADKEREAAALAMAIARLEALGGGVYPVFETVPDRQGGAADTKG